MLNRLCWISLVGLVATMLVQTPTVVWAQAKGDAAAATPQLKFEVYQDAQSQYRWRLVNGEGKDRQVLATGGQGYKAKADCQKGIDRLNIEAGTDKLKFEVYDDNAKEQRWRLKSANGQVVASSSQGYKAKADCEHAIDLIKKGAATAEVEDKT